MTAVEDGLAGGRRPPLGRLTRRAEFLRVADGRRRAEAGVVVQMRARADNGDGAPRVGFTVTKKVGNAVERNRVRRRLRAAAQAVLPPIARPGCDYVLVGRRAALDRAWPDLKSDLERALGRVHAAKEVRA